MPSFHILSSVLRLTEAKRLHTEWSALRQATPPNDLAKHHSIARDLSRIREANLVTIIRLSDDPETVSVYSEGFYRLRVTDWNEMRLANA